MVEWASLLRWARTASTVTVRKVCTLYCFTGFKLGMTFSGIALSLKALIAMVLSVCASCIIIVVIAIK